MTVAALSLNPVLHSFFEEGSTLVDAGCAGVDYASTSRLTTGYIVFAGGQGCVTWIYIETFFYCYPPLHTNPFTYAISVLLGLPRVYICTT